MFSNATEMAVRSTLDMRARKINMLWKIIPEKIKKLISPIIGI